MTNHPVPHVEINSGHQVVLTPAPGTKIVCTKIAGRLLIEYLLCPECEVAHEVVLADE